MHAVQRGACDAASTDTAGGRERSAAASISASARCPAAEIAAGGAACIAGGAAADAGAVASVIAAASATHRDICALGDCGITAGDAQRAYACRAGKPTACADEAAAGISVANASAGSARWRASCAACFSASGAIRAAAITDASACIAEATAAAGGAAIFCAPRAPAAAFEATAAATAC